MSDLDALLRAIVTNPDEDTPRLMYADALDERGEPGDRERAEFIRRQCGNEWTGTEGWVEVPSGLDVHSERGFLWRIKCDAAAFLRHADELLWHPTQTVECVDCRGRGYNRRTDIPGVYNDEHVTQCVECTVNGVGQGRVPRPCPPTAQPIRRVVLTTTNPEMMSEAVAGLNGNVYSLCRWPGVEFVLPSTGTEVVSDEEEWADHEVWGAP